eukprot:5207836-Alexandrium_andersonii.AAC.1
MPEVTSEMRAHAPAATTSRSPAYCATATSAICGRSPAATAAPRRAACLAISQHLSLIHI